MTARCARPQRRRIALLVPVTSRGRAIKGIEAVDLLRTLLPGIIETATWSPLFEYTLYVGYDAGDALYDGADARRRLAIAIRRFSADRSIRLVASRSNGTAHAPCAVWNALFSRAYGEGCDYFYQLGDDVRLETRGWAEEFVDALRANPTCSGLGAVGPIDDNVPGFPVLTQAFVSRVHMDIFGTFYPPVFRNWFSDNWLTAVYAPQHLWRSSTQHVRNAGGAERYAVDAAAEAVLEREIRRGRRRIDAWLAFAGRAVLPEGLR